MQAVLPVARALTKEDWADVHIYGFPECAPLLADSGLEYAILEASSDRLPCSLLNLVDDTVPSCILSGIGPARGSPPETPEQHLFSIGHRLGIPTVGVLDYWGMYRERFFRGHNLDLSLVPHRLCVLDWPCRDELLQLGLPGYRAIVTHNPWMDAVMKEARAVSCNRGQLAPGLHLLFISQPLAEMRWHCDRGYDQEDLFCLLTEALPVLPDGEIHRITVWVHPQEDDSRWIGRPSPRRGDISIEVSSRRGAKAMRNVDLVVTSHSTTAYEALYQDIPVLTLRPGSVYDDGSWRLNTDLVPRVTDRDQLADFLAAFDFDRNPSHLRVLRERLTAKGIFFTDGCATSRVMSIVRNLIGRNVA